MSSLSALSNSRGVTCGQNGRSRVRSHPSRGSAWTVPDFFQRSRFSAGFSLRVSRQELSVVPVPIRGQRLSCAPLRPQAPRAEAAGIAVACAQVPPNLVAQLLVTSTLMLCFLTGGLTQGVLCCGPLRCRGAAADQQQPTAAGRCQQFGVAKQQQQHQQQQWQR